MNRRSFLRGAGGLGLALPFLASTRGRTAYASPGLAPKRLIVVQNLQGTVLDQWTPVGTETAFTLGPITQSLAPYADRMVAILGLDNRTPDFNTAGNGHQNANASLLTCQTFQDPTASTLVPNGPSIEQVIAERIGTTTPFRRLDFGIGGGTSGNGLLSSDLFWYGAGDPVSFTTDPVRMFNTLFSTGGLSEAEQQALRTRRTRVLDAVRANFGSFRRTLDQADRARLDAHAEKVYELESRLTGAGAAACATPTLSLPSGYDYGFDDHHTTPVMIDLLVSALACDQTRVATLWFATGHDPTFPWLNVNGGPVVDTSHYDNWHAMVHEGRTEQGLVTGFTWYAEQVAALLARLDNTVDIDGDNMLDTSLVVWTSEFGDGIGHNTRKIPVMLFGCLGGAATGRFIDLIDSDITAYWTDSGFTTAQLWVSLLQLFGGTDTEFGITDSTLPMGPLPGLL